MKDLSLASLRIFTISVLILLLVPELIKDGMFADGVLYAAVAHNEAHGFGSFWFPQFSATLFHPFFHQQPPLTFGIQAVFFKVLGDSIYVERLYSLFCAIGSALLIAAIWREINHHSSKAQKMSWVPVLFWIITPVCFFAFRNNLEENSLCVFSLISVWMIIRSWRRSPVWHLLAASLSMLLAWLCKGFPGLYPLALPSLYWLVYRKESFLKMMCQGLILGGGVVVCFSLLLLNASARVSLGAYLHDRVLNSILDVDTGQGRLHLLVQLCADLGVPGAIAAVLFFIACKYKNKHTHLSSENKKQAILFLGVGACASLPLMITGEQRWFYTVPAIPAFALCLASLVAPAVLQLHEWMKQRRGLNNGLFAGSILLLLFSLVFSGLQKGKIREKEMDDVTDSRLIGLALPRGSIVNTYPYTFENWAMHQYLARHFSVSLESDHPLYEYFLTDRSQYQRVGEGYRKIGLATRKYDLYKRIQHLP